MGENALKQRTTAAVILTETIREMRRYMSADNISIRLLQQKLTKTHKAKEDLLNKHYLYAEKSGKELDSAELTEWINPRVDEANDVTDEVFIMIEDLEEIANKKKVEEEIKKTKDESVVIQKQCEATEIIIKERLNAMIDIVNDANRNSVEDRELVLAHIKEVENFMEEQTKSWNKLKTVNVNDENKL